MARHGRVFRIVVGALQHDLAVLEHLEELVHLHRMQLADFIQEEHAAMRPGHCSGLGLRDPLHAKLTRALINGVVNAADERIGNGALVEPHAGRIHFNEGRIL